MTARDVEKDQLFENGIKSSTLARVQMMDFDALELQVLQESAQAASSLGVARNLLQEFALKEFAKMKDGILAGVEKTAVRDVAVARRKADSLTERLRRSVEEMTKELGKFFAQVRSRPILSEVGSGDPPELKTFSEQLQRIETAATEEAIGMSTKLTERLADCLRLGYQHELRLVFQQAFIGKPEVAALVQFYLSEVPELQLAA